MNGNQISPNYVAGIFDIAGTIRIEYSKSLKKWILLVWITHDSFKLMETLQCFGAYIVKLQNGLYRAKWREKGAYNFLQLIYPFSLLKTEQINVSLEYFSDIDHSESRAVKYQLKLRLLKKKLKQ